MKITSNFSRSEMACPCGCGFDSMDYVLGFILEKARYNYDSSISINKGGGCRCLAYNEAVQKKINPLYISYSSESLHMWGRAADICITNVEPVKVADYFEEMYPELLGIGRYPTFTHIDTRSKVYARWGQN